MISRRLRSLSTTTTKGNASQINFEVALLRREQQKNTLAVARILSKKNSISLVAVTAVIYLEEAC